jgi:hypothetical protein
MKSQLQRRMAPAFASGANAFGSSFRRATHSAAISAVQRARAGLALLLIFCLVPFSLADLYAQEYPPSPAGYSQLGYAQLDQ